MDFGLMVFCVVGGIVFMNGRINGKIEVIMKGIIDNLNGGKSMINLMKCLLLNLFYVFL